MDDIIIHEVRYMNDSHDQAVASITYVPINGNEPFSYFVVLNREDDAPIHKYIVNKIRLGEIEIQPCYAISSEVKASNCRSKRDSLLAETDKYMTIDYPITEECRAAFREYRQALRDITEQEGFPDNVIWPVMPEIVKSSR